MSMDTSSGFQPTQTGQDELPSVWADHLAQLWLDRQRIAVVLCLGVLITLALALTAKKQYTSEASLLLRLGREYLYTPEVGDANGRTPLAYDREQTVQAETRILLSRDVLEAAVDKLGVATIYPRLAAGSSDAQEQRAKAVLALEKSLDAELLKNSNLMQVEFKHDDPNVAASTLGALVEAYLDKRKRIFASPSSKAVETDFKAQADKLHAAEARLLQFKRQKGIHAFAEEQSLLLAQRNALELKQSDVALNLVQAGGRADALSRSLSRLPKEVVLSSETQPGEAAESALKLLMDLKLKERDLSAKFMDTEPAVKDVKADIALTTSHLMALRANPPKAVRMGRSQAREAAETDLERTEADKGQARAGESMVSTQLARIDKRLAQLTDNEQLWQALERDRRLAEADYEAAAKRLSDERIVANMDRQRQSSVSVVQSPKVPLEGKSPRLVIIGVGMVLTLAAALFTAFVSALFRQMAQPVSRPSGFTSSQPPL